MQTAHIQAYYLCYAATVHTAHHIMYNAFHICFVHDIQAYRHTMCTYSTQIQKCTHAALTTRFILSAFQPCTHSLSQYIQQTFSLFIRFEYTGYGLQIDLKSLFVLNFDLLWYQSAKRSAHSMCIIIIIINIIFLM